MNFLQLGFRKLSSERHTDRVLRVLISGHVTKMAVTQLDPPYIVEKSMLYAQI